MRSESAFRPNEEDVELVYALSGSNPSVPDMLHKLSSSAVVEKASAENISSSVEGMTEHITKERGSDPKLIVAVHTHPQSIPRPSKKDKQYFQSAYQVLKSLFPEATVLFGIHAISSEVIRERSEPVKTGKNIVQWNSITREHEAAFYTDEAKPYEVELVE
jgi:hypothetical protein